MSKINAKQIENCLDTVSAQEVTGAKQYAAPQAFTGNPQSVVISGGFIYWVQNVSILNEEGNSRLSMSSGARIDEVYQADNWNIV